MNIEHIREEFPSLKRKIGKHHVSYLDGPAGTQVPKRVVDAMANYYYTSNANTHGYFAASQETDEMMSRCRVKAAEFLSAPSGDCISFGQNMTTLNFSLATAIGRSLQDGDIILITELDHEANRGPWISLKERGIIIKEIPVLPNATLDYKALEEMMSPRVRLIAVGMAANFCGTVNDISRIKAICQENDSLLLLDAVHYAPHFKIDVQALDCDFLLCSGYKFYGPHVGILYSKPGLLDSLEPNRLRTQEQVAPYRIETGTLNHAAFAGLLETFHFLEDLSEQKDQFRSVFQQISAHERLLANYLYDGLVNNQNIDVVGPDFSGSRAPTISFVSKTKTAKTICQCLGAHGIYGWDGHFYAIQACECLGLLAKGGVTRLGISIYTTKTDIDRTLSVLQAVC